MALALPRRRRRRQRRVGPDRLWDAAAYRSDDIDPQVARYAFDLGNLSFANGWVAAGAVCMCAGLIMLGHGLPSWLGWWAILAGVGQVIAEGLDPGFALAPGAAYWIWVAVLSVVLIRGRFAVAGAKK